MPIRIILLDDHPLFRGGLRAVLEAHPDVLVLGEAADARAALALLDEKRPDVAVADVSLPSTSGIDFTREVHRRSPETRVLVLTMHAKPELASEAFEAGAKGYALKSEDPATIVDAVRTVARGELYLSPSIPRSAIDGRRSSESPLADLSPREREIFALVVRGLSNENIARELDISVKTVQTHRAKINQKLRLHSTGDLVRFAALRGLISE
ncbi:MAG TPA: response regulator transcription factor [Polyangiaceae bacterium]|jgi:DNA-binding NarL/FixJ family response regulator